MVHLTIMKRLSFLQDTRRGLILATVLYIVSMILGMVSVLLFDSVLGGRNAELNNWIVSVGISVGLAIPFTKWYFEGPSIKASHMEGAKVGAMYLLIGLLIDLLLAIPFMIQNGIMAVTKFYTDSYFFVYLLVVLLTTTFVGSYYERK